MVTHPPTVLVDIDGTLLKFVEDMGTLIRTYPDVYMEGCEQKLALWHTQGIRIILVTGRPEPMRADTEKQLKKCGMVYDQLIMGCGCGPRFLINDARENKQTAFGLTITRDYGIKDLELNDYLKD